MRGVTFAEGEFYHLYNRGVDKRIVFTTPYEYRRFQAYLYLFNDLKTRDYSPELKRIGGLASLSKIKSQKEREPVVAIGAYCLMPNHFHLYVAPLVEDGVSKFMQRLQTAYTMYFNKKHERSGSLFQGTFKAKYVNREEHARYLLTYIHLNPAKLIDPDWMGCGPKDLKELEYYIRAYPYSSFSEYAEQKYLITDPSAFPDFFPTVYDFDTHIRDWLQFKNLDSAA